MSYSPDSPDTLIPLLGDEEIASVIHGYGPEHGKTSLKGRSPVPRETQLPTSGHRRYSARCRIHSADPVIECIGDEEEQEEVMYL